MTRLAEISVEQVVLLRSPTKDEALRELVDGACRSIPGLDPETAFRAVRARETLVSSWVAPGIAMPHARLDEMEGFAIFVGRSIEGVDYEAADTRPVHLLVLILGDVKAPERHLAILAECARTLREPGLLEGVLAAETREAIAEAFRAGAPDAAGDVAAESRLILAHATELAEQVGATAILVQLSAVRPVSLLSELGSSRPVILVVENEGMVTEESAAGRKILSVPFEGLDRSHQVSVTLFLALSRRLIGRTDRVVALFGRTGAPDSLLVLDVARELPAFLPAYARSFLGDVDIHVLERVLHIAVELAREGREGRAVGALFVVGDYGHVHRWSHQMVMNPFRGYAEEEKNILDPSLGETVKEFCAIDGAFLIGGNGVIEAAGAHVRSERQPTEIPGGLGARHAAAAAITAQTTAISVAVSQSTGRVSVYKAGDLVMVLERASQ